MRSLGLRSVFAGAVLMLAAGPLAPAALAWGPQGHAIVAEIAEIRLSDTAKQKVQEILSAVHKSHLDEVASWADDIRPSHPDTAPWHFVDIPLNAAAYKASRDCKGGACVVVQIQRFVAVLKDGSASAPDRLEALKFIVHFVGDIHQPLHDEDHGDKGGNTVHLTYFGKSTNLHAVWDGGIIEKATGIKVGPHFSVDFQATRAEAEKLNNDITAAEVTEWAPAGMVGDIKVVTVQWANDSHKLAQQAYKDLPAHRTGNWAGTYQQKAWPVVEGQLERGGVRLAEVLNEALQ
jgi:hypothetical protein